MLGLRVYFAQKPSTAKGDNSRLGFAIGRQIVGLYLTEIALKYALDEREIEYEENHNIETLFLHFPEDVRARLRRRYVRILHSEPGHAWDFQASIDDFVRYLAEDPFTVSRYYWDLSKEERTGVLFSPGMLVPLVDAVLCELHGLELAQREGEFFERDFQSFDASVAELGKGENKQ